MKGSEKRHIFQLKNSREDRGIATLSCEEPTNIGYPVRFLAIIASIRRWPSSWSLPYTEAFRRLVWGEAIGSLRTHSCATAEEYNLTFLPLDRYIV